MSAVESVVLLLIAFALTLAFLYLVGSVREDD